MRKKNKSFIHPVSPTTLLKGQCGLTKREYFAGLAMQAQLSNINNLVSAQPDTVARFAIVCADALMIELMKAGE